MDITLCPLFANSIGKEPTTSPKPPVLEYGAHSVDTKTIFIGLSATSTAVVVVSTLGVVFPAAARTTVLLLLFVVERFRWILLRLM
tara:strand:- start:250 stop:507 length:258 start_codon:yes stop_codon:yes gene_type:complete